MKTAEEILEIIEKHRNKYMRLVEKAREQSMFNIMAAYKDQVITLSEVITEITEEGENE